MLAYLLSVSLFARHRQLEGFDVCRRVFAEEFSLLDDKHLNLSVDRIEMALHESGRVVRILLLQCLENRRVLGDQHIRRIIVWKAKESNTIELRFGTVYDPPNTLGRATFADRAVKLLIEAVELAELVPFCRGRLLIENEIDAALVFLREFFRRKSDYPHFQGVANELSLEYVAQADAGNECTRM